MARLVASVVPTKNGVRVKVSKTVEDSFRYRDAKTETKRIIGRLATYREKLNK